MLVTAIFSYIIVKRNHGISLDDKDSVDNASEMIPLPHYFQKKAKLRSGEELMVLIIAL